jgi:hypothetical protein
VFTEATSPPKTAIFRRAVSKKNNIFCKTY